MAQGKFILQGIITLCSPTLIGSGKNDESDIDVLVDIDGKTPFIPATSLIGVLQHHIRLDKEYRDDLKRFWGFTRKDSISEEELERQSAIRCSDLYPRAEKFPTISWRDGVKIDINTGQAKDEAKYNYQVIERGSQFDLKMEVDYADATETFARRMLATICDLLKQQRVRLGTKTNNGLGLIQLENERILKIDYTNQTQVLQWLKKAPLKEFETMTLDISQEKLPLNSGSPLKIEATFDLKHSLLVRAYPSQPQMPDAVNVKSGDENVLPGSSLKGAIRARAERILRTQGKNSDAVKSILTELFGDVEDKKRSKTATRGKVSVRETVLNKFLSERHHRVKIDRFSGGTIESALFETEPVYPSLTENVLEITIAIRDYARNGYEDYEAGLLLLVLKDLWTGDLALGGEKSIGRGVLQGCRARVYLKDREAPILIDEPFSVEDASDRQTLEELVKSLQEYQLREKEEENA